MPAGEIYIVDLLPNADGSKQSGWDQGTGSTYEEVNDSERVVLLPDANTDYWESDTSGDERSVDFQSMADLGFDEVDQIYVVAANAPLFNATPSSTASVQVRLFSGSAVLRRALNDPPKTNYSGRYILAPLDPATSLAWTLCGVSNVEFGVYTAKILPHAATSFHVPSSLSQ